MNPLPINPDTPRKPSARQHLDLNIDAARAAVVKDLGDIAQVSVKFFINYALPAMSDVKKRRVQDALSQSKKGFLDLFPDPPETKTEPEPQVFAPLKDIFDAIVACLTSDSDRPRLKYVHSPGSTPGSERANSTRPDAQLELLLAKSCKDFLSDSAWSDIPLIIEEKKVKDASTILDNDHKIIWAGHHMLSNDPCRRFAFGITVENEQMKLWHFSRAQVMVSEPFDWRREPLILIHVFGSLAFATDVELGYDPTVVRFVDPDDGMIQYKLKIQGDVYVTKNALADYKADPICGRATRVWETYLEGDESKTSVALKDIWLDSDAELEGDFQKRLIDELEKLPKYPPYEDGEDDEERREHTEDPNYPTEAYAIENPSQYFLTVLAHGVVKIDGVEDDTKELMMRGQDVPLEKIYRAAPLPPRAARSTISRSDRLRPVGGPPVAGEPVPEPVVQFKFSQPKKHYRIVFREVGTPIHDLTSFKDIFKALSDIIRALHCLFILGYVHRDISTGNILFYLGIGKLCDLEFAKQVDEDSSHEMKTGTPDFIAVEIRDRKYRFRPTDQPGIRGMRKDRPRELEPVMRYNALHDLESTWWIALWMLFFKGPLTGIPLPPDHSRNRDACFPRDHHSYGLRETILSRGFQDGLEYLPESLRFLGESLEDARMIFKIHYPIAELKIPVRVVRWWRVHELLGGIFDRIIENCGDVDALWAAEIAEEHPGETSSDDNVFLDVASSVDAERPRKRHNTGSIPLSSLHKSVRSQFSTKTSSQRSRRRTPPGSIVGPAHHTRSHGPPS